MSERVAERPALILMAPEVSLAREKKRIDPHDQILQCRELPNRGGREELYYAVQVGSQQKNCLSSRFSPISLTAKVSWFGAGSRQAMQELMLEQEYGLSGTVNRFCSIEHPVLAVLGRSPQASWSKVARSGTGPTRRCASGGVTIADEGRNQSLFKHRLSRAALLQVCWRGFGPQIRWASGP